MKQKFPQEVPDRRTHVHAREGPGRRPRRHAQRYRSSFPVTIHVGAGEGERRYKARAWDVSDGGVLLEGVDIPKGEKRLRLEFDIPAGGMPEEYVHSQCFRFPCHTDMKRSPMLVCNVARPYIR